MRLWIIRAASMTALIGSAELTVQVAKGLRALFAQRHPRDTMSHRLNEFFGYHFVGWMALFAVELMVAFAIVLIVLSVAQPEPAPTRRGFDSLRGYLASLVFLLLLHVLFGRLQEMLHPPPGQRASRGVVCAGEVRA